MAAGECPRGRKAVRICRLVASLFCLFWQGSSGEERTGGGSSCQRYKDGKGMKAGKSSTQRNATQRNRSRQSRAQPHVHTCGSHEIQVRADTTSYLSTTYRVPRQSTVPPAIFSCLASARSCLPCSASYSLGSYLLPTLSVRRGVLSFFPAPSCQLPLCFY